MLEKERVIELEKLGEERIVIETCDQFSESVFNRTYDKAKQLLDAIIREDEQIRKIEGDKTQRQISNVISFEGRRGTGKTSAMLSFHEALKSYRRNSFFGEDKEQRKSSFAVLDYIDASMLERGEDILELVLANMLSVLEKEDRDTSGHKDKEYEKREIYRCFDNIYGSLIQLREKRTDHEGMSPIRVLAQVASSQKVGEKIRELVKRYLDYMLLDEEDRWEKRGKFLVIAIDDLDMNFQGEKKSPYDTLETLHRYLMVPGVIILLAYDFEDLYVGCTKHFAELYDNPYETDCGVTGQKHAQELAREYLNKVIPLPARIHMPSFRKRDYMEDRPQILIKDSLDDHISNELRKYINKNENGETKVSVKRFSLLLKYIVGGLRYDGQGRKRHFSEPSSFRELSQMYSFYQQLDKMERVHEKKDDRKTDIYKALLDDIYFRFAPERLQLEEQWQFNRYLDVDIERRSRDILKDIIAKSEKYNGSKLTLLAYSGKSEPFCYSYGELLYGLYKASSNGWFSKELIWCILDSYTVILTQLYRELCNGSLTAREKFIKILGASVSSSWSNLFIPQIEVIKVTDSKIGVSQKEKDQRIKDNTMFSLKTEGITIGARKYSNDTVTWEFELGLGKDQEELGNMLKMLEVLCMFFTDVHVRDKTSTEKEGFQITYSHGGVLAGKKAADLSNEEIERPVLKLIYTDGCFNILNFVNNMLDSDVYFEQLHRELSVPMRTHIETLAKHCGENLTWNAKGILKKYSLKSEVDKWKKIYMGFALPLYSFDMMYNILKRRYQTQELMPEGVRIPDLWGYIKKVYLDLGKLLRDEDEFYFGKDVDSLKECIKLYNAFYECPFIRYVIEIYKEDTRLGEMFKSRFDEMISIILQAGNNEPAGSRE